MPTATTMARAYINIGRWVADCPQPHCNNASALTAKQAHMHCGGVDGCQLISEIEWPSDADAIWEVLQERPVPRTRNWAPAGHWQAVVTRFPDGQTVADLRDETAEHMTQGGK